MRDPGVRGKGYFRDAVILAGLRDKVSFHSLRHLFAVRLLTRGVPIAVVSDILGHCKVIHSFTLGQKPIIPDGGIPSDAAPDGPLVQDSAIAEDAPLTEDAPLAKDAPFAKDVGLPPDTAVPDGPISTADSASSHADAGTIPIPEEGCSCLVGNDSPTASLPLALLVLSLFWLLRLRRTGRS